MLARWVPKQTESWAQTCQSDDEGRELVLKQHVLKHCQLRQPFPGHLTIEKGGTRFEERAEDESGGWNVLEP